MIIGKQRAQLAEQVATVSDELQETARAGTAAFLAVATVAVVALLIASAALIRAAR